MEIHDLRMFMRVLNVCICILDIAVGIYLVSDLATSRQSFTQPFILKGFLVLLCFIADTLFMFALSC